MNRFKKQWNHWMRGEPGRDNSDTPSARSEEELAEMLVDAVVIVAHPDDESLWFSSILARVDKIIICLTGSKARPELGPARRASLASYPLPGLVCLDLDQSDTFGGADWRQPVLTEFGIALPHRPDALAGYQRNFHELLSRLRPHLKGYGQVFTHTPWGEYGHEDHVQVHRVVSRLQRELNFQLWYPNYCSSKCKKLSDRQSFSGKEECLTLKTDLVLASRIKANYQAHHCWTWDTNWEGFSEESFIGQSSDNHCEVKNHRKLFTHNVNRIESPDKRPGLLTRILSG